MQLLISRAELARAIGAVHRVVESRNIIPILSNLKLEAANGELRITATDLTITATVTAQADIVADGAACVDAKLIGDIAKKSGGDLNIAFEGETMAVKSGRSRFALKCLPAADFPTFDDGAYDAEFGADIGALFAPIAFAMSTEETRYWLNGVYLHNVDGVLTAVATDGHRLARNRGAECPEFAGVIVPHKAVGIIPTGGARVSVSGQKMRVAHDDITITTKLIDHTYPDYPRVIPTENPLSVTVDRDEMMAAADRVVTVSSEKAKAVRLSIAPGSIVFSARSDIGTAEDEVAAEYSGEPLEYGLNSAYIRDMLAAMPAGPVTFALRDNATPAHVTGVSENWDGVLMPLRV
jgi:DNA polymerase-3 subunit beta